MKLHDTIAAIATPIGSGGIAILRISGADSEKIAQRVLSSLKKVPVSEWESYKMMLCKVHEADCEDKPIDQALAVVMRAPRSYTGETVVEIHCHGGFLVADRILKQVLIAGARLAEGGEFTRRAFLNGKTSLNEAEAVMDVIDAHSELGLENAAKGLNGALSKEIDNLREKVMEITSHISAAADYPEEVDAPDRDETEEKLCALEKGIEALIDTFETGRMLRDGITTVIVGRPNVGKSSMLNALSRTERAIVTDIPGTTRDVIEEYINIAGVSLRLLDTAGLRDGADEVERLGIDRAKGHIKEADLCLFVLDGSQPLSNDDIEIAEELKGRNVLVLLNKTDKERKLSLSDTEKMGFEKELVIETATPKDGQLVGIDKVEKAIAEMFLNKKLDSGQVYINNARQRDSLQKALDALKCAKDGNEMGVPYDLLYVDLEDVLSALGEVTGVTVQEEIIDQVFSRFCVGK